MSQIKKTQFYTKRFEAQADNNQRIDLGRSSRGVQV